MSDLSTVFEDLSREILLLGVVTPCDAQESARKMAYLLTIFEENVIRLRYAQAQWRNAGQGDEVIAPQSDLDNLSASVRQFMSACDKIKGQSSDPTAPIELDNWDSTPGGYKKQIDY
jgi:hypothetical protein